MKITPELDSVSIVLLGSFNPAIFTPAWFELHRLLPKEIVDVANLEIAHKEVTMFEADWLRLNVSHERFQVETTQAPYCRIHDLILRIFREHLLHTPLTALGINRSVHFQAKSVSNRDKLGRILAPVEPWGDWAQDLGPDGDHGGMTSLTMTQNNPELRPKGGRINVTVEPSTRIGEGKTGVYVRVNDHYVQDGLDSGSAERFMEILEENFEKSMKRTESIINHLMCLAQN